MKEFVLPLKKVYQLVSSMHSKCSSEICLFAVTCDELIESLHESGMYRVMKKYNPEVLAEWHANDPNEKILLRIMISGESVTIETENIDEID